MLRDVLLCLVLGVGVLTRGAAAKPVTLIEFEITFPDGTKRQMNVTDPHFVPLELPSGSAGAGLFLMLNPSDHNSVAVVFYSVRFTGDDLLEFGPLERKQTRTELGRDTMKVGGEAIQSKTLSPFRIRVTKVVHQER
jgi:hypothetical protein